MSRKAGPSRRQKRKIHANRVSALLVRARSCHDKKDLQQAHELYRKVLEQEPENLHALHGLGLIALDADMPDTAAELLQAALNVSPDQITVKKNLALVYTRLERIDEAIALYRQLLKATSGDDMQRAAVFGELARLYLLSGNMEQALGFYHRAFSLNPLDPRNLHGLMQLDRDAIGADEMRTVENLLRRQDLPLETRSSFYFALGSIHDRDGSYDQAFANYSAANLAKGLKYDAAKHEACIDKLIDTFTPALFEQIASAGDHSLRPVFIVGMPRSGTTLVEQILAAHSDVFAAGELNHIERISKLLQAGDTKRRPYPQCLQSIEPAGIRQTARSHETLLADLCVNGESRVTDKMPTNFLYLGLIALLFPGASIIHCRRDPLDVCLSCYFQNFAGNHPYSANLRDLGHYYRQYQRLMAHWRKVLPIEIHNVDYERLVLEPEQTSRRLIESVGLEWQPACREFYKAQRHVHTASVVQVRQPLYHSSIQRWRHYDRFLQPLKKMLNARGEFPAGDATSTTGYVGLSFNSL